MAIADVAKRPPTTQPSAKNATPPPDTAKPGLHTFTDDGVDYAKIKEEERGNFLKKLKEQEKSGSDSFTAAKTAIDPAADKILQGLTCWQNPNDPHADLVVFEKGSNEPLLKIHSNGSVGIRGTDKPDSPEFLKQALMGAEAYKAHSGKDTAYIHYKTPEEGLIMAKASELAGVKVLNAPDGPLNPTIAAAMEKQWKEMGGVVPAPVVAAAPHAPEVLGPEAPTKPLVTSDNHVPPTAAPNLGLVGDPNGSKPQLTTTVAFASAASGTVNVVPDVPTINVSGPQVQKWNGATLAAGPGGVA